MAYLYESTQIEEVLRELRIKAIKGKISGDEAARVLSWRAKNEQGVDHAYKSSIIRRHAQRGNLKSYAATQLTKNGDSRRNVYDVSEVFYLPIAPKRAEAITNQNRSEAIKE